MKNIFDEIDRAISKGSRRELESSLRPIIERRVELFYDSIAGGYQESYTNAMIKALFLEMDEDEDVGIEIAELVYLSLSMQISQDEYNNPYPYKQRVLLLHYFYDYFVDTFVNIFLKKYRKDNILESRSLSIESLLKMARADLYLLEDTSIEFVDTDSDLNELTGGLSDVCFSDDDLEDAGLLHKILGKYLYIKYLRR